MDAETSKVHMTAFVHVLRLSTFDFELLADTILAPKLLDELFLELSLVLVTLTELSVFGLLEAASTTTLDSDGLLVVALVVVVVVVVVVTVFLLLLAAGFLVTTFRAATLASVTHAS